MTGPIKGNAKLMIIHKVADNQAPEARHSKMAIPTADTSISPKRTARKTG